MKRTSRAHRLLGLLALSSALLSPTNLAAAPANSPLPADHHSWLGSETLQSRVGSFEFMNGYPAGDSAQRLRDLRTLNRGAEVYLAQMMRVSAIAWREGMRAFGAATPQQVVIWENLMDARTLLLTGNAETVYSAIHLNVQSDGPTVVEAPPSMLGFMSDALQRYLADIGPLGADKGQGGKYLVLPPGYQGAVPEGYFVVRSPTYSILLALRGFQANGNTDQAVGLMKQIKVYPLAAAADPPAMSFTNGSGRDMDTIFPDNFRYFELLAMLVNEEPAELFDPSERAIMHSIGIEKGKPFQPDPRLKALLTESARLGSAMARENTYASDTGRYYPGRQWQGIPEGLTYTFVQGGIPQIDIRNWVYYMALGNSPAIMAKNIGRGSQYLWTYRDATGAYLDGAKTYRLRIPAGIPAMGFWSVVVYDSLSRSQLQNGQSFPAISSYTRPVVNADGSIDVEFGPAQPEGRHNWIRTVPGKGWFPFFRFYAPTEAYFDKTWQLEDIVPVRKDDDRSGSKK
jgi:hypothetical protein